MSEPRPYPSAPQAPDPSWPPPGAAYGHYYGPPRPPGWFPPPGSVLAGWGARFAAQLFDGLLATAFTVGPAIAIGITVENSSAEAGAADTGWLVGVLTYFGLVLIWLLAYHPLTMRRRGRHNGQTLGKQLLNIRVARLDRKPVTAGTAYLRDVLMKNILLWGLSARSPTSGCCSTCCGRSGMTATSRCTTSPRRRS